jgi:hypothetical protein
MISRPCYSFREETQRSIDFVDGVDQQAAMDRALMSSADNIEGEFHRQFYPWDGTTFHDWPDYDYSQPWKLYFGRHDLVCLTQLQSPGNGGGSGGVSIPLWQVFPGPANPWRGFPYTRIELDRSSGAVFNPGATPQHSIWATGTWGFTADADQVAVLAESAGDSDQVITLSDGSKCGPGDVLILGYSRGSAPFPSYPGTAGAIRPYLGERVIAYDRSFIATGLTQSGSGCQSDSAADNALQASGTGSLNSGEVILLDQERMLIEQVSGGVATVRRGWDGTVLAPHNAAEVLAGRQLSVIRAELGTASASYESGAAVYRHRPPSLIRDLSIAEAVNQVEQEGSGYARVVGGGDASMPAPGVALADKWDECRTRFGRKARISAV